MPGFIYEWDEALFRWVNDAWSCRLLDVFFCFVTNPRNWIVPIVIAVVWLVWKGGSRGRFTVMAVVLSIAITDPLSVRVIKPLVKRVRPCNLLSDVRTPCGGSSAYSFPSVHAANQGASMTILSLAYPPATPTFAGIALLVGLSRVYLGLHYPSDILGGFLLGMLIGIGCWWLADHGRQRWIARKPPMPAAQTWHRRGK
jgi:undecaprenyl-diphosphatase